MFKSYRTIISVLSLILFLVPAMSALADEIVFPAGQDSHVNSSSPSASFGSSTYTYFGGNLTGGEFHLYLEFDVATIDPSSTISGAQLELFLFSQNGDILYNYSVMQVTGAWSEGALTWNNRPTVDPVAATTFSGAGWQGNIQTWQAITGLEDLVQYWVANPDENHGLMIKATSNYYGYAMICSSEYSTSSQRPRLVVTGTLVPNEEQSWGGVKALYR